MKAYLFLDTNTLLHYKNFDQILWLDLFGFEKAVLVITATVANEIDKKKYDNRDSIQKRARSVSKLFGKFGNDAEVREKVTIKYIAKEPIIDWEKLGLDKEINDDRILAAFINYKYTNDGEKHLVTQDGNFIRKAAAFGVTVKSLPDDLEIELTTDAEKELQKIKAEIIAIKNQKPNLSLKFTNGEDLSDYFEFRYERPRLMDENVAKKEIGEAKEASKHWAAMGLGDSNYVDKYERYIKELGDYQHKKAGLIVLEFVLTNDANVPANIVKYRLTFPSYLKISELDDLLEDVK